MGRDDSGTRSAYCRTLNPDPATLGGPHDEVLRDALKGQTLQSLASETTEATVAELAQYRRF